MPRDLKKELLALAREYRDFLVAQGLTPEVAGQRVFDELLAEISHWHDNPTGGCAR